MRVPPREPQQNNNIHRHEPHKRNSFQKIFKSQVWNGRPTNVNHFRVFGRKCYIKREDGKMGKFDSRVDKGILVGYQAPRKHTNSSI